MTSLATSSSPRSRPDCVQFDERDGLLDKATFTDAPVFGDWTNLADPDYGVPTDTDWPTPARAAGR